MRVLIEIIKVVAEIKDDKLLLILAYTQQILAQTGTTTFHLLKFYLRVNWLEEYQVQDLWHIDTSIKHIHTHSNTWLVIYLLKLVEQMLLLSLLIVNHLAIVWPKLRIQHCKSLSNLYGMLMVVRKDDGLTNILSAIHAQPLLHQFLQHLVDRVSIIDVAEYLVILNIALRHALTFKDGVQLFLLIFRTIVVFDTVLQDIRVIAISLEVHQMPISYGLSIFVIVVGHTILQFQQPVSATINLLTRCSRQTNQQRVEVIEYGTILTKH